MAEKNPLEKYLDQIRDMFNLIMDGQKNIPSEELPPGIEEEIKDLEKSIQAFCDFNENLLKNHQISDEDIKRVLETKDATLNPNIQRVLEKSTKLKKDIQIHADMLQHTRNILQKHQAKFGKATDPKEQIRKRQKRFRQFGSGDWIKS